MIRRLRIKFVVINMSIVMLMLCFIFGLVFHFTRTGLETESMNMMRNIANQPFRLEIPDKQDETVRLPYFVVRLGAYGELTSMGGGYYDLSDDEFIDKLVEATVNASENFGVIEEYNLRYYRGGTPLNPSLVFADISSEVATLNHLMKTCLFIGALSFLVFLAVSILLSGWAVKPVENAWKQQRQFVADASHELKTPLTVIMTSAELLQSPEYTEESKSKFVESITVMSRQMKGLIGQLLELAKAENGQSEKEFRLLDFSGLVAEGVLPFEAVFFEKNLTLKVQIQEQYLVKGVEAQLRQVLEILLDNAQKYSGEAGTTMVTLGKSGRRRCTLCVSNEGKEIDAEEIQHIFERFYRADKARSRTDSFGLGLSIAEGIVAKHKGKIWAESKDGVNSFYVELPC